MKKLSLLLVLLQILAISCITRETEVIAETVIYNDNSRSVNFIVYYAGYVINNVGLLSKDKHIEVRSDIGSVTPFPLTSDSIKIIFDNNKVSTYYNERDPENNRSPYSWYYAYKIEYLGNNHTRYTYTITEEDFEKAIPIDN